MVGLPRETVATGEFRVISASSDEPRRGDVFGIPSASMFVSWSLILEHTGDRDRHMVTVVHRDGVHYKPGALVYGDVDSYGKFKRARKPR